MAELFSPGTEFDNVEANFPNQTPESEDTYNSDEWKVVGQASDPTKDIQTDSEQIYDSKEWTIVSPVSEPVQEQSFNLDRDAMMRDLMKSNFVVGDNESEQKAELFMRMYLSDKMGKDPRDIDYRVASTTYFGKEVPAIELAETVKRLQEDYKFEESEYDKYVKGDLKTQLPMQVKYWKESGRFIPTKEFEQILKSQSPKALISKYNSLMSEEGKKFALQSLMQRDVNMVEFKMLKNDNDRRYMKDYMLVLNPSLETQWSTEAWNRLTNTSPKTAISAIGSTLGQAARQFIPPSDPENVYQILTERYGKNVESKLFQEDGRLQPGKRGELLKLFRDKEFAHQVKMEALASSGDEIGTSVRPLTTKSDLVDMGYVSNLANVFREGKRIFDEKKQKYALDQSIQRRIKKEGALFDTSLDAIDMGFDIGATLLIGGAGTVTTGSPLGGASLAGAYSYARFQGEFADKLTYEYDVNPDEAFAISTLAGLPYAAVEVLQVGRLAKLGGAKTALSYLAKKIGKEGSEEAIKKGLEDGIKKSIKRIITEKVKAGVINWGEEISEESLQAAIEQGAVIYGTEISNEEAVKSWLADTKAAIGPMGWISALGVGTGIASESMRRASQGGPHDVDIARARIRDAAGEIAVPASGIEVSQIELNMMTDRTFNDLFFDVSEDISKRISQKTGDMTDRAVGAINESFARGKDYLQKMKDAGFDTGAMSETEAKELLKSQFRTRLEKTEDIDRIMDRYRQELETLEEGPVSRRRVDTIVRSMGFGEKDVKVVKSMGDVPQSVRGDIAEDSRKIPGIFNRKTGEIYIISDNIALKNDVPKIVLEEAVGHKGFLNVLGEKNVKKLVSDMTNDTDVEAAMMKVAKERNIDFSTDEGKERTVLEMIADRAISDNVNMTVIDRMKGFIRDTVRKVFNVKYTNADINYLVRKTLANDPQDVQNLKDVIRNMNVDDIAAYSSEMDRLIDDISIPMDIKDTLLRSINENTQSGGIDPKLANRILDNVATNIDVLEANRNVISDPTRNLSLEAAMHWNKKTLEVDEMWEKYGPDITTLGQKIYSRAKRMFGSNPSDQDLERAEIIEHYTQRLSSIEMQRSKADVRQIAKNVIVKIEREQAIAKKVVVKRDIIRNVRERVRKIDIANVRKDVKKMVNDLDNEINGDRATEYTKAEYAATLRSVAKMLADEFIMTPQRERDIMRIEGSISQMKKRATSTITKFVNTKKVYDSNPVAKALVDDLKKTVERTKQAEVVIVEETKTDVSAAKTYTQKNKKRKTRDNTVAKAKKVIRNANQVADATLNAMSEGDTPDAKTVTKTINTMNVLNKDVLTTVSKLRLNRLDALVKDDGAGPLSLSELPEDYAKVLEFLSQYLKDPEKLKEVYDIGLKKRQDLLLDPELFSNPAKERMFVAMGMTLTAADEINTGNRDLKSIKDAMLLNAEESYRYVKIMRESLISLEDIKARVDKNEISAGGANFLYKFSPMNYRYKRPWLYASDEVKKYHNVAADLIERYNAEWVRLKRNDIKRLFNEQAKMLESDPNATTKAKKRKIDAHLDELELKRPELATFSNTGEVISMSQALGIRMNMDNLEKIANEDPKSGVTIANNTVFINGQMNEALTTRYKKLDDLREATKNYYNDINMIESVWSDIAKSVGISTALPLNVKYRYDVHQKIKTLSGVKSPVFKEGMELTTLSDIVEEGAFVQLVNRMSELRHWQAFHAQGKSVPLLIDMNPQVEHAFRQTFGKEFADTYYDRLNDILAGRHLKQPENNALVDNFRALSSLLSIGYNVFSSMRQLLGITGFWLETGIFNWNLNTKGATSSDQAKALRKVFVRSAELEDRRSAGFSEDMVNNYQIAQKRAEGKKASDILKTAFKLYSKGGFWVTAQGDKIASARGGALFLGSYLGRLNDINGSIWSLPSWRSDERTINQAEDVQRMIESNPRFDADLKMIAKEIPVAGLETLMYHAQALDAQDVLSELQKLKDMVKGTAEYEAAAQALGDAIGIVERTGQSAQIKDVSDWISKGGSGMRAVQQFASSPIQILSAYIEQYNAAIASIETKYGKKISWYNHNPIEAYKLFTTKEGRKFLSTVIVGHVIFAGGNFAIDMLRKLARGDEIDKDDWISLLVKLLIGPASGVPIIDDLLTSVISGIFGTERYDASIPMYGVFDRIARVLGDVKKTASFEDMPDLGLKILKVISDFNSFAKDISKAIENAKKGKHEVWNVITDLWDIMGDKMEDLTSNNDTIADFLIA